MTGSTHLLVHPAHRREGGEGKGGEREGGEGEGGEGERQRDFVSVIFWPNYITNNCFISGLYTYQERVEEEGKKEEEEEEEEEEGRKRVRHVYTREQILQLEYTFRTQIYPETYIRKKLAVELGISQQKVQVRMCVYMCVWLCTYVLVDVWLDMHMCVCVSA